MPMKEIMKKFIEIVFAFVVIVVIVALLAISFGVEMNEAQKAALSAFCFGGCLLAVYWLMIFLAERI